MHLEIRAQNKALVMLLDEDVKSKETPRCFGRTLTSIRQSKSSTPSFIPLVSFKMQPYIFCSIILAMACVVVALPVAHKRVSDDSIRFMLQDQNPEASNVVDIVLAKTILIDI